MINSVQQKFSLHVEKSLFLFSFCEICQRTVKGFMFFGYSMSVNIIQLFLCGNTELVAKNNSAWMFDATLQLQGILLQSSQLLCTLAFCSWILYMCECDSMSVWVWMLVLMWYVSPRVLRSYYIQWNLYDNCAAGNINYTYSLFSTLAPSPPTSCHGVYVTLGEMSVCSAVSPCI